MAQITSLNFNDTPCILKVAICLRNRKEREKIKENEMQENVAIVSSGPSANLSMSIFVQSLNERLVIR